MDREEIIKIILVFIAGYLFFHFILNGSVESSGKLELGSVISNEEKPEVLYHAPDFSLKSVEGKDFVLSDFRGKTVVLAFWAEWCGPCMGELPSLNRLSRSIDKNKVEVVSVVTLGFDEDSLGQLVKQGRLAFPVLMDKDDVVSSLYKIRSVPLTMIIDAKGVIRYRLSGARDWNSAEAIEDIYKIANLVSNN